MMPGRDRVALEPDHEVEDRSAVGDADLLLARQGGEDLLGEVEGVVRPLVEGEPWRVGEIGEGDAIPSGQGVALGDEDVRLGDEERVEREPGVPEQLVDDVPVEVVPVEDAELAAQRADVLDDVPGAGLAQRELVLGRARCPSTMRTNASTANE